MRGLAGLLLAIILLPLISSMGASGSGVDDVVVVEGSINGTVVWANKTYRIVGRVVVEGKLVVEPGTVVEFAPGSRIVFKNSVVVLKGRPGRPVILSPLPGGSGGPSIALYNSSLDAGNTVFEGATRLGLIGSRALLRSTRIGPLVVSGKDSLLSVEESIVESITVAPLYPEYTRSPRAGNAGLLNTTLILAGSIVEKYFTGMWGDKPAYIMGATGYAYPAVPSSMTPVVGSKILIKNTAVLLGLSARLYSSLLVLDNTTTRELILGDVENSDVTITSSLIAWGRGVYVDKALGSNITIHNTSIHDNHIVHEPIETPEKAGVIVVLADARTRIDLRHNWWGDPSGPSGPLNPQGKGALVSTPPTQTRLYPWLVEPPRPEALNAPEVVVIPPLPVNGEKAWITTSGPSGAEYYVFIVEKPNSLQPNRAHVDVNRLGRTSLVFNVPGAVNPYNRTGYCIVFRDGLLAGASFNVTVIPEPQASLRLLEPATGYTNKTSVVLRVAVSARPSLVLGYLNASLIVDGEPVNSSYQDGVVEAVLGLREGVHTIAVEVRYFNTTIGKREWRVVVDRSPPEITVRDTGTGTVEVTVKDSVSGLRLLSVTSGSRLVFSKSFSGMREYTFKLPAGMMEEATILAVDMAGNKAVENITGESGWGEKQATTTTITHPSQATDTTTRTQAATTITRTVKIILTTCPRESFWASSLSIAAITVSLLAIIVALTGKKRGERKP